MNKVERLGMSGNDLPHLTPQEDGSYVLYDDYKKLADELERNEWISVDERIPEEEVEEIICWDSEEKMELPTVKPTITWSVFFQNDRDFISHWRYVPQPPKDS